MKGRKIFAIHSILGLITGLLLLVISFSGAILVFSDEIDHQFNAPILKVKPGSQKVSLNSIYKKAQQVFPGTYIRFRHLPAALNQSIEISVEHDDVWILSYFDPYTGKYLGSRDTRYYFTGWLVGLHYSLLAGKFGELIVGILSISLVLSVVTGIYVYRKHLVKVLTFRTRLSFKNWRQSASSLHRIIGVWSLMFNLLFAITGFWMLRYVFLPSTYQQEKKIEKITYTGPLSMDQIIQLAEKNKKFKPSGIHLPTTPKDNIIIYGSVAGQSSFYNEYANSLEIDSKTGKEIRRSFIEDQSGWDKWDMVVYPLHTGMYGNLLLKIIYCIAGVTPALLSISGFFLWFRRKYS